jgi:hypothetical protein
MSYNKKILRNKSYDKLPVHRPDEDLWDQINARLNEGKADNYHNALSELPAHKAPSGIWEGIEKHLSKRRYRLALIWLGLATAASIAIFTVLNSPLISTEKPGKTPSNVTSFNNETTLPEKNESQPLTGNSTNLNRILPANSALRNNETTHTSGYVKHENSEAMIAAASVRSNLPKPSRTELATIIFKPQFTAISTGDRRNGRANTAPVVQPSLVADNSLNNIPQEKKVSRLSLALAYIPESINNGYNPAIFHNVDLTASVDLKNLRLRSSMGMTYNSEHYSYSVNASRNSDNMNNNPGYDSTNAAYESVSNFEGVERHGFVSWDIGAGHKLFSTKKFTTWINAGAGLDVRVNNASLRDATIETMSKNYNSTVNSIDIDDPIYNRMSMSLVSGIEFDYRIIKRLSLSMQPQIRYYLYPIFKNPESLPDPYSLGFRTGIKFDL